jgi:hypothetical protein
MKKLEVSGKKIVVSVCLSVIRRSSETCTSREKLLQLKKSQIITTPKAKDDEGD